ncbi:MAG: hypothetical protein ACR2JF_16660 [Iamia sp.]
MSPAPTQGSKYELLCKKVMMTAAGRVARSACIWSKNEQGAPPKWALITASSPRVAAHWRISVWDSNTSESP